MVISNMKVQQKSLEQQINFHDEKYNIISAEQGYIVHPAVLGLLPLTSDTLNCSFQCFFSMENYQLYLDEIYLDDKKKLQESYLTSVSKGEGAISRRLPVFYNGAILIGRNPLKEYMLWGKELPCFSFKSVYELVFNKGILETTIDHSRDMLRIRKNLELGLRSLGVKRDLRCIKHFLNSSFVGDYRPYMTYEEQNWFSDFLRSNKRLKYLDHLKETYQAGLNQK